MASSQIDAKRVRFNDSLIETIDETLSAILSREVMDSLYARMKRNHAISKDEIPYRLDALFSELEIVFGVGAKTLSRAIAQRFYQKLGLEFPSLSGATLLEYVEMAKQKIA